MSDEIKKPSPYGKGPAEAYRKTDVMTANKETILLMMYAGAIRFTKRAVEAGKANDIATKCEQIGKVQEIITELRSTLNFEVGGEIAKTLDLLYTFMNTKLAEASMDKEAKGLADVLQILTTLNEGWEQAVSEVRKEKSKTTTAEK